MKAHRRAARAAPPQRQRAPAPAAPVAPSRAVRARAVALALVLLVLAAYWPALDNGFIVQFDDDRYVTANARVQAGLSLPGAAWAFTTFHAGNWHPLTWLSHMLDVELFGLAPRGPHAVNLLLHAANTVLILRFLVLATGALWPAAFVAALFGLHPVHVESVAWIAERKDLLATLFWALALLAYLAQQRRPTPLRAGLVLLAFAGGLLAKPIVVTLPFLLLLLDWWPLGRHRLRAPAARGGATRTALAPWLPLLREKAPLFAFAAASCALTLAAQARGGAVGSLEAFPFALRLGNAASAYAAYLRSVAWPAGLAAYYPHPLGGLSAAASLAAAALLAAATALVWWAGKARPFLRVGWFWFLGTLVPVIGLVQAGSQSRADRYLYVPIVGLGLMAAWWAASLRARRAALAAACLLLLLLLPLGPLTRRQVGVWKDSDSLFLHAVGATSGNWLAHYNLGVSYGAQGRAAEAIEHYRLALAVRPSLVGAHVNLGSLLSEQGRGTEALAHFREALRHDPGCVAAHVNLGIDLSAAGQVDEAIEHYEAALRLQPDHAQARANLRWLLLRRR